MPTVESLSMGNRFQSKCNFVMQRLLMVHISRKHPRTVLTRLCPWLYFQGFQAREQ